MAALNRLSAITLWVTDPEALAGFYCDTLGMKPCLVEGEQAVGYGGEDARLVLRKAAPGPAYRHQPDHRYWKIAITLPDLDLAHAALKAQGIDVTPPHQFRDIARMSHLADPEGHVIELIQHTFEGQPLSTQGVVDQPLGGGARIGLVTLRTEDIAAEMQTCVTDLGMRYLSRQAVTDLGFDLYFFALSDDRPPVPDVDAIANRTWLWQRPFTSLEFMHPTDGRTVVGCPEGHKGAATVTLSGPDGGQVTLR